MTGQSTEGTGGFTSLLESLLRHAERQPEALAYVSASERIDYAEFARRVTAGAIALQAQGVGAGDCVALDIVDDAHAVSFLAAQYAAAWLGARVLPLYPDVPEARRREILEYFAPPWVISARPGDRAGWFDVGALHPTPARGMDPPPRCDTAAQPYQYLFSSGTTGAPKAALFTAAQMAQMTRVIAALDQLLPTDRVLPAKAWPSAVGMRWARRVLDCGAALYNLKFPRSYPEFVATVAAHGLTGASASPWQARTWLACDPEQPLATLRFLELAGAPTYPAEIAAIRRRITPRLILIYGSNEAGIIAFLGPSDPADGPLRIAPGMEAKVVDEAGRELPIGGAGRLGFRAPWIATSYSNNAEATRRQFDEGWCFPGDHGVLDGRGGVILQGRSDDLINQGGNKIVPAELEAILIGQPQVLDAAVVGISDPLSGEQAVACVCLRAGTKLPEIRAALAARISGYAMPRVLVAVRSIPRNAEGKIDRAQLRVQLERRQKGPESCH